MAKALEDETDAESSTADEAEFESPENKVDKKSAWTSAEEYVKTLAALVRESVTALVVLPDNPRLAPSVLLSIRGVYSLVRPLMMTDKQTRYDERFKVLRGRARAEQLQATMAEASAGDYESLDALIDDINLFFDDVMTEAQQHELGVPEKHRSKSAMAKLRSRWNAKPTR